MLNLDEFNQLIPASLLDELAIEYNVNAVNQVKLTGQTMFICLLNGIMNHPILTQRILEDEYKKQIGETCDHSAFGKRLSKLDPLYFQAILEYVHEKIGPEISIGEAKSLKLRFIDSTTVTLSSKLLSFGINVKYKGDHEYRHVKSVVELSDDGLPNLLHICDKDSDLADSIAMGNAISKFNNKGDLWIFDRGMSHRGRMFEMHNAGSFFLTRYHCQLHVVTEIIMRAESEAPPVNTPDIVGTDCAIHRVESGYLMDESRPRIPGLESMQITLIHCHRYDTKQKVWKPLVLMTNLPLSEYKTKLGPYSFEEITELYRRRWDIEIFFKFLKQRLGFKHLTNRSENGIRTMVIMSIISALLLVWYKHKTGIDRGWKSVIFWFAEDLREWTKLVVANMIVCQRE